MSLSTDKVDEEVVVEDSGSVKHRRDLVRVLTETPGRKCSTGGLVRGET